MAKIGGRGLQTNEMANCQVNTSRNCTMRGSHEKELGYMYYEQLVFVVTCQALLRCFHLTIWQQIGLHE